MVMRCDQSSCELAKVSISGLLKMRERQFFLSGQDPNSAQNGEILLLVPVLSMTIMADSSTAVCK